MAGMIYTFYSYKGGVGRSMALANIGMYFYLQGYTTLLVDWDLEAPGLERYFEKRFNLNVSDLIDRPGLIDIIKDYKELSLQPLEDDTSDEKELFPDLNKYLFALDQTSEKKLYLLHAGRRSPGKTWSEYASFVQTFDWTNFYEEWEGGAFIDWLQEQFRTKADIVLIDSRTGVTEMGGVATQHLADVILLICSANLENIDSTARMARNFTSEQITKARNGRQIEIMVVPSRIDNSDTDGYKEFLKQIENVVAELPVAKIDTGHRLTETIIPYFPAFSYRETLIFGDRETESLATQLAKSYSNIAANMELLNISKRYERARIPERNLTIFLNYSRRDLIQATQIKNALEAEGYHIWIDTVQIKGGDDWFKAITEGIEKATFFISIASKNAKESRWVQREFLYAEQKNKIILPIKIDESDIPVYMLDRHVLIADKNFDTALAQLTELISKQVEGILQEEALSDTRQFELDYLDKLTLQYNR